MYQLSNPPSRVSSFDNVCWHIISYHLISRHVTLYSILCSHSSAAPQMPTECSSRRNRISWLIVSKAHDKSSNTSIVVHFLSSAVTMPFFTRMSAVSVEWPARYAGALSSRWAFNCFAATFSTSLDTNGMFDTGQ